MKSLLCLFFLALLPFLSYSQDKTTMDTASQYRDAENKRLKDSLAIWAEFKQMLDSIAAADSAAMAISGRTSENGDSVFNHKGKLIQFNYSQNHGVVGSVKYEKYEYDSSGNMTYRATYGWTDELKAPYGGVAGYKYKYDHKKNITELRYIGENGNLVQERTSGVAIFRYTYNSKNLLTDERFYDKKGLPVKGKARSEHKYNATGILIEDISYDEKGNIIDRVTISPDKGTGKN